MTLFRILKETLGDRADIARLYSVQFEEAPYYLEIEDTAGGNLAEWLEARGGIESIRLELRLEIVAQIATALSAAHSVGVIHKDVKPSNVLVEEQKDAAIQIRLTDFGIGMLIDREALERAGITETGMTEALPGMTELSSRTGTRMYMAPELIAGRPPSIQSDIYALGVLMYQLVIGNLSQPMTTDWEQHVEDPLLREDLRHCLAGEPGERFAGAADLANRLYTLPQRRAELAEREAAERAAARRRRIAVILVSAAGLFVLLAIALGLGLLQALRGKEKTEYELYISTIAQVEKCINDLRFNEARTLLARCPEKYRGWEWGHLQYRCNPDLMTMRHSITMSFSDYVRKVAFSPDGTRLASACYDRTAKLWDVETGREIRKFEGHFEEVVGVVFSPDGKYIATASFDKTARLWDVEKENPIKSFAGHSHWVLDVAFSPGGKTLATASSDGTARLWDVETGKEWRTFRNAGGSAVISVAFSPDGTRLVSAGVEATVILWDIETTGIIRTFPGHTSWGVPSVTFSPDGKRLATAGCNDGTVRLWDVQTAENIRTFECSSKDVWHVAFSPDGSLLAAAGFPTRTRATAWDVKAERELWTFEGNSDTVSGVAFTPDGTRLATASGDGTARLWDLETQTDRCVFEHVGQLYCVAVAPDGMSLAAGGINRSATLWHVETGRKVRTFPGASGVWSVAFNPRNAKSLAVGFEDGKVRVWDVQSGDSLLAFKAHSTTGHLSLAFSPDGKRLATATGYFVPWQKNQGEETAKLWDTRTGDQVSTLVGHTEPVNSVAFSPDGRYIATGSHDRTARLWDANTSGILQVLPCQKAVHSVAFSPDATLLATGSYGEGGIKLWNVRTGQRVRTFTEWTYTAHSMVFSPDGKRLAVARHGVGWELWDVERGRKVLTLTGGHKNAILCAAMFPGGRQIATASYDGNVILWPSFPWNTDDYPGDASIPLVERIELYKREYWKKRLEAKEEEMRTTGTAEGQIAPVDTQKQNDEL
jgi:WD40 repeat protein